MSVIWSGVTAEGAVVPVQVTDEGKVVAVGDGPQGDYLPITGGNLTGDLTLGTDEITLNAIDGSTTFMGQMLVGLTASTGNNCQLQVSAPSAAAAEFYTARDDFYGPYLRLSKGRGTPGSEVIVNSGDELGVITFQGHDNDSYRLGAQIAAVVDGTPGVNDMPGRLSFATTADGASSPTERMRLDRLGDVKIGGTLPNSPNISLNADGNITAQGYLYSQGGSTQEGFIRVNGAGYSDQKTNIFVGDGSSGITSSIKADGSAVFGDVVIGSRGEKWLIRESNGVAMLIQQSREAAPMIPEKVRDIPAELDLIEMALNEVMEKLRMTPPAGWPVWDGSDNP